MKRILSVFLVLTMCLSLVACSSADIELYAELFDILFGGKNPWDSSEGTTVPPSTESYKVPIILLHGRVSNTGIFFGVNTSIDHQTNSCYETENEILFTNPDNHEILSIEEGKLGAYLINELGYEPNKNLFAFNYPNQDMVERNAKRLAQYVNNLVEAASTNSPNTAHFVDGETLFASKSDQKDGRVQFILIGHSMGGLVARYYIENIGTQYVDKLITICTPHFGSNYAYLADLDPINPLFEPCDVDLQPNSQLFGGEKDGAISPFNKKERHAYLNQSKPLKGNQHIEVEYYAIGGYDTDFGDDLASGLKAYLDQGEAFLVSFDRNTKSKQAFRDSINSALSKASLHFFGETSTLDLGDGDGDNVVDFMSQFAVNFDKSLSFPKIEKTSLILSTGHSANDKNNRFHNEIAKVPLMHMVVAKYIAAEPAVIASGNCNSSIFWSLDVNGTLTLTGSGKTPDYGKSSGTNQNDQPWYPYRSSIRKIIISQGIQELGWYNFTGCENLTEIEIANSVTHLGYGTFVACNSLESVILPDSIKHIGWDVFFNCKNLKNVTLSNHLLQLGYHVFFGCESLETITIPASVKEIGMNCFKGCFNLKKVYFLGDLPGFISGEFHETHPDLTLYYTVGAEGWTQNSWKAPDGTVYRTDTFTP